MAILEKINLDFQAISTGDPKVLVVMDTSTWGIIADKPAIIEIIPPNKTTPKKFTLRKNGTNVFNTSNLLLSAVGCYNDLPDGLYQITIKGSPDTNCKHRDYLKTDKIKLELYQIYVSLGFNNDEETRGKKEFLQDIDLMIRAGEYSVALGEKQKGLLYHKKAMQYIKDYINCKTC